MVLVHFGLAFVPVPVGLLQKILLEQAHRNMYKCKAEMKEHHKNSHGEI